MTRRLAPALTLLLALPALAQDAPPPRKPAPPAPPLAPQEGDALRVERPEEIKAVRLHLDRVQQERTRLSGKTVSIREEPAPEVELGTLVIAPRTEVLGLRLQDAIEKALANNPDYLLALLDARVAREQVPQEQAVFDPAVRFTGTWSEARPAFFSNNPFTGLPPSLSTSSSESLSLRTTVSQLLPTGTQLSLGWDESRTKTENVFSLNPSYSPALSFTVTQPLLRGFGLDVNLARLRIAENDSVVADAALASTYLEAVLAVEQAYWALIQAEEGLKSQERSLASSIQFLDDQRKREQAGAGTKLEVTIAKSGVAERREALIQSGNDLESARDQIVRLCLPSSDPSKWNVLVIPVDLPRTIKEPKLDVVESIQVALKRRPDYYQGTLGLDSARRNLVAANNAALPQLNLIGTWTQEGLGGQHHSAWSSLGSGRFYTWSVGVSVDLPLFLRAERARARQAKLQVERAEVNLRRIEANIVLEVRQAIRDIHTAKARIEASRAARILARERLDATREMLKAGTAVPRDVLDDIARLAAAEAGEVNAFVNYRLALTRLRRARGTLLDPWLEKLPGRVRRALDRTGYQD